MEVAQPASASFVGKTVTLWVGIAVGLSVVGLVVFAGVVCVGSVELGFGAIVMT